MNAFELRDQLIANYASFATSFAHIGDARIARFVREQLAAGYLWPDPLVQLNPAYAVGASVEELVAQGLLHPKCSAIFRRGGQSLTLYRHQVEAIEAAHAGHHYVLTTGTGSGKSLAYIIPIVDHVLRAGPGGGVRAIIIYPMNALVNSQLGELEKFLGGSISFGRYTGQEGDEERRAIIEAPPDILLTNYAMLELLLTRQRERALIQRIEHLRFLVLDELHTYRGRQGADVALLLRRVRERLGQDGLQLVGTSATMSSKSSFAERAAEIAEVASKLFGAPVAPERVIGETLRRRTPELDVSDPKVIAALRERLLAPELPADYQRFIAEPIVSWIETTFGVVRDVEGRLVRAMPKTLRQAASELSQLTGIEEQRCQEALQKILLTGSQVRDDAGAVFAFKLHQFISRGDTVYASLEAEDRRHLTLDYQQFVPNERDKLLFPLAFCRECGQAYYTVWRRVGEGKSRLTPRKLSETSHDDGELAAYLYLSSDNPWPEGEPDVERLPEDWLEERAGELVVRPHYRKYLPLNLRFKPDGREDPSGITAALIKVPFRFCLHCGVSYSDRQGEFSKLGLLAAEGRASATTVLSLAVIRELKASELPKEARKLLSFTDNRQDASLQAGHLNDFVEVSLLRAGLYRAVQQAGPDGLAHDELTQRVFAALDLALSEYAADPEVKFQGRVETDRALREVLGYRIYRDLKRGWRLTAPNLEQTGLLEIQYRSLDELCATQAEWRGLHSALATATPEVRMELCKVLADLLRWHLAISVDYLNQEYQERLKRQAGQWLKAPWNLSNEKLDYAGWALVGARPPDDRGGNLYLSARSRFGRFLRRKLALPSNVTEQVISELLEALRVAGIVQRASGSEPAYQLNAAVMRWCARDGSTPVSDPLRIVSARDSSRPVNPFFRELYQGAALAFRGICAREHTAQVPLELRLEREARFREGSLPILYCSPTMELGIDISDLNVVNLRNVPPTPANYAQRSGRAGRSGQAALVITYASNGSSHDQYFFKRPEQMVAGVVAPPRLELANEELVRAHVQAIWLAETGADLGSSLSDVLEVGDPELPVQGQLRAAMASEEARKRAYVRAERVLAQLAELRAAEWYHSGWLEESLRQALNRFEGACERWRTLYRSAVAQFERQSEIIKNAATPETKRNAAKALRAEAERQLELLLNKGEWQNDFYSYRYFASEGFLPGYAFPRLPLSAFVPGRRSAKGETDHISRPRFLAISEFGPRAILYHEGEKFEAYRVMLPPERDPASGKLQELASGIAKLCQACGYLHPVSDGAGVDLCERCGASELRVLNAMFRLQNVITKRRERISSDEEERQRLGYELITGVRFVPQHTGQGYQQARVVHNGQLLATLQYGQAANIWRINLGWLRRANKHKLGFGLDLEGGHWKRDRELEAVEASADDDDAPANIRYKRVIPYVEDRRNALLWQPALSEAALPSLQAALKVAIQVEYQLEDNELAAEALPDRERRRLILFYEAAEGGAGVLQQLLRDPLALKRVARRALELCHFDPDTHQDLGCAPHARERCEAACYDCLMSYSNQLDHLFLDRHAVKEHLIALSGAEVVLSPTSEARSTHLARLLNACDSELERDFLRLLEAHSCRLPSAAQKLIADCRTRPDFLYEDDYVALYIDGPPHDYPERQQRDSAQQNCLEDLGYTVLRFKHTDDWPALLHEHAWLFGGKP